MKRYVLVTGGAGYIGAHVCKALAKTDIVPVVLDDLSRGHREFVRWGPLIEAGVAERGAVAAAISQHRPVAVIHLAGLIEVGESVRDPALYLKANFSDALALIDAVTEAGPVPFVFSSTAAVYGAPERVPIPEDHPTRPVNPYGESKLMVERALGWIGAAKGLHWTALRYFNAAGADPDGEIGEDHEPESHLIPIACHAALGRRPALRIFGTDYPTPDGTAVRDFIHVADLARAHVAAVERLIKGGASGAFNLGTGRGHSVRQAIAAVAAAAGRPVPTELAPRREGDPAELVADPAAARAALGWLPEIAGIDDIAASAWRWHLQRHGR